MQKNVKEYMTKGPHKGLGKISQERFLGGNNISFETQIVNKRAPNGGIRNKSTYS